MAKAASRLCIDDDDMEMRKNIEEQSQAAKALQTYVDEVMMGFETLLHAQEKLKDGAMKELRELGQTIEAPLDNFGRAVRHMREMASHTTVGLQVHQRKLIACHAELARTDKTVAMLQSMGVALRAHEDSCNCDANSKDLIQTSEGRRRQKTKREGERLAKLIHAAKAQQACARSTLEACVTRRENLVELARKSLQAVAKTIPQVDETVAVGFLDRTILSNSVSYTSESTCNEPWNPFGPDLMEVLDDGSKCNDSTLLKRQVSGSTLDTTISSGISQQDSDTSSTIQFVTSDSPEEEHQKNPFDIDSAEVASTTSQPLEPAPKNQGAEDWANNPLTEDSAKVSEAKYKEHIPNEDADLRPLSLTPSAKLIDQNNDGSTRSASRESRRQESLQL